MLFSFESEIETDLFFENPSDDVDFINPNKCSLPNYIEPMSGRIPKVIHRNTHRTLISSNGFGWCANAIVYTT